MRYFYSNTKLNIVHPGGKNDLLCL